MSEATVKSIEILVQGYPMTFVVILGFYFLIKLMMLFKPKGE